MRNFTIFSAIALSLVLSTAPALARPIITHTYAVNGEKVPKEVFDTHKNLQNLVQVGNYAEADARTQKLIDTYPNYACVHFLRAFYLDKANKNEDATREIKVSIRLNPNFPDSWMMLGSLAYVRGRLPEALKAYEKFVSMIPQDHPKRQSVTDSIGHLKRALETRERTGNIADDAGNYLASVTARGTVRWPDESMPVRVYIEEGTAVPGYQPWYRTLFVKSLDEWSRATDGKVSFKLVGADGKPQIKCIWTADIKRLVDPAEGGHAQFAAQAKGLVSGEIVILTRREKIEILPTTMHYICLHEIGHIMGLHGHSTEPKDIMYLATKLQRTDEPQLTDRDVQTLKMLYSRASTGMTVDFGASLPNTPVAKAGYLNNLGNKAVSEQNYELAIEKYQEALKIMPGYELAKRNLAVAYCNSSVPLIKAGEYEKALPFLEKAIGMQEKEDKPDNLCLSLRNYKTVLERLGRNDDAAQVKARLEQLQTQTQN